MTEKDELLDRVLDVMENKNELKRFSDFIKEEIPSSSTANVEGLRTEPVIKKKDQEKIVRRHHDKLVKTNKEQ